MLRPGLLPLELFFEKKKRKGKKSRVFYFNKRSIFYTIFSKNSKKRKKNIFYLENLFFFKRKPIRPTLFFSLSFKKILESSDFRLICTPQGLELHFLKQKTVVDSLIFQIEIEIKNNFFIEKKKIKTLIIVYNIGILDPSQQKKVTSFFSQFEKNLKIFLVIPKSKKKIPFISSFSKFKKKKIRKNCISDLLILCLESKMFLFDKNQNINLKKKTQYQKKINLWGFLSEKKGKKNEPLKISREILIVLFSPLAFNLEFKKIYIQSLIERWGFEQTLLYCLKGISKWKNVTDSIVFPRWKRINFLALLKILIGFSKTWN